ALDLLAHPRGLRLLPATLQIRDDALEAFRRLVGAQAVVIVKGDLLIARPVQYGLPRLFRQVLPPVTQLEAIGLAKRLQRLGIIGRGRLRPGGYGAVSQGGVFVRHDQARVYGALAAQAIAGRAGAERIVEGKQTRLDLRNGEAGDGTGELFRKQDALVRVVGRLVG